MSEETKISEALKEIKESNEDKLKEVIQEWYNKIHAQSMKIGASYISAAVYDAITKNIKTGSLRDYQRAIKAVQDIIAVQLKQNITQQNDSSEEDTQEEEV